MTTARRVGRIAYVNGRYLPHGTASVHVEDRGYQFADAVYESCEVRDAAIVDLTRHLDRLERSLAELRIAMPMSRAALALVMGEVARRNRVHDGAVYLQISRGVARRDHPFPARPVAPAVVVTARHIDRRANDARAAAGIAVITLPDTRWGRVDIKTVGLLPNVLAKQAALEAGAKDAWFVDDEGYVTEASAANVWIVTADGTLVTRPSGPDILPGVTRMGVANMAAALGLKVEWRRFTVEEARTAREASNTSATALVMPVTSLDGTAIANGHPGLLTLRLRAGFHAQVEARSLGHRIP